MKKKKQPKGVEFTCYDGPLVGKRVILPKTDKRLAMIFSPDFSNKYIGELMEGKTKQVNFLRHVYVQKYLDLQLFYSHDVVMDKNGEYTHIDKVP